MATVTATHLQHEGQSLGKFTTTSFSESDWLRAQHIGHQENARWSPCAWPRNLTVRISVIFCQLNCSNSLSGWAKNNFDEHLMLLWHSHQVSWKLSTTSHPEHWKLTLLSSPILHTSIQLFLAMFAASFQAKAKCLNHRTWWLFEVTI